jgi:putative transposase (fragment)
LDYRTPAEGESEFWEHHPSREIMEIKAHLKTPRQKIVEILLMHYLVQHGDEAVYVLHCYTEQKVNHRKHLSRRKTGYRTEEDNLDFPLGPEYQDPDVHGIYIPEKATINNWTLYYV